jgi:hypothetical protein
MRTITFLAVDLMAAVANGQTFGLGPAKIAKVERPAMFGLSSRPAPAAALPPVTAFQQERPAVVVSSPPPVSAPVCVGGVCYPAAAPARQPIFRFRRR